MMDEHPITHLAELQASFPGPQLEMTIASILAGNTLARLWLGDGLALLWDQGNNVFYLTQTDGAPQPGSAAGLSALIAGPVRAAALERGRRYFRARAFAPLTNDLLQSAFAPIGLHPACKRFYRFTQSAPGPTPEPSGVVFAPIDGLLLRSKGIANVEAVRGEIGFMWPSPARFYAHGFGVAAMAERTIICWCTAEYVSRTMCGIGIETVESWQDRGVATAAALRFVRRALAHNIIPHWECDTKNGPSVRVAEKVGFTLLEETIFWAGSF
jgi:hypothetical protein